MAEFDVVLEVDTDSLTEEAYRVGSFSGTVTLLVEAQARQHRLAALVQSSRRYPMAYYLVQNALLLRCACS